MQVMRMLLRFLIPLIFVLGGAAYLLVPFVEALNFRWYQRDIEIRAKLIANTLEDSLQIALQDRGGAKLQRLFNRVTKDERLFGMAFCSPEGRLLQPTPGFPKDVVCPTAGRPVPSHMLTLSQGPLHVSYPEVGEPSQGHLVLLHDMSFVQRRSADSKFYLACLFLVLAVLISGVTVFIAQLSLKGWIQGLRVILKEGASRPAAAHASRELRPIVKDLRQLIRELETDRRARDEAQLSWTPRALKDILQQQLAGDEVLIVSNREPYIHVRRGERVEIQFPASGLVTALEPIMRACSGTWVAHGSGNADRDVVDKKDHVRVPPVNPSYQIRRVWLSKEEEQGYYYGFANEGLWALCHIAHVRPIFRSEDWAQYQAVNEKFARTVIEEAKTEDPVILVQDYHFALLPKLIRERLPKATVITFWHIPFPNPEVFSVCPFREQILEGLLGSSILGFHTRFHCNNFIDTVDRFLESRIDRELSTISHKGRLTAVNSYPISIEYPVSWIGGQSPVPDCRARVRERLGLPQDRLLGVGIDRLDYTKGILERFRAVERLLELEPKWIGKFSFLQVAAPSRTSIDEYRHFDADVRELAARINGRFGRPGYEPVLLKIEHYEPAQVYEAYRASELCFVSSLHDGMNLVAKEFVAARDDERGVLILSQFTGAARELPEALIVNPYDIDQCAMALRLALEMQPEEQRDRMRSMRGLIQEFNVYRWAGRMLLDAAKLRQRTRLFEHFQAPEAPRQNL